MYLLISDVFINIIDPFSLILPLMLIKYIITFEVSYDSSVEGIYFILYYIFIPNH